MRKGFTHWKGKAKMGSTLEVSWKCASRKPNWKMLELWTGSTHDGRTPNAPMESTIGPANRSSQLLGRAQCRLLKRPRKSYWGDPASHDN